MLSDDEKKAFIDSCVSRGYDLTRYMVMTSRFNNHMTALAVEWLAEREEEMRVEQGKIASASLKASTSAKWAGWLSFVAAIIGIIVSWFAR